MTGYAAALAASGIDVVTFNFPYMDAGRRIPDKAGVLEACFRQVIAGVRASEGVSGHTLFIGGKSMGGRMATHVAAAGDIPNLAGVVALGYPLHPPGKPDRLRIEHLSRIRVPLLIVQGERDTFGTPAELGPPVTLVPGGVTIHEVPGGDHSFTVRGVKPETTRAAVVAAIVNWMGTLA